MMLSPFYWIEKNPGPHESDRFPGWQLYYHWSIIPSELILLAKRKSDQKVLQFEETCDMGDVKDFRRAMGVLHDRLGEEFLDLVPRDDT